ncbi:MAG: hypothetical protein KME17_23680 [Cyanosarcina radialis HA8281-LM2]|jgi:hydrogenase-4 component E|nr:hypothetical protein [Cyanosarcina radialis HA8281-LM2]
MNDLLFSQLSTLVAASVLLFGILLVWRRSLLAYIKVFQWQSTMLTILFAIVAYFGNDPKLYWIGVLLFFLKVIFIPRLLQRFLVQIDVEREVAPYINTATSLVLTGVMVLLAQAMTNPLIRLITLPTRNGLPFAVALIFIGLFVIITRKKAFTQVLGFLVMENGIAMLAVLGTFGIPLIVELGVFLDLLMGFLVMQVFVYQIQGTFESIDVSKLNQLRY